MRRPWPLVLVSLALVGAIAAPTAWYVGEQQNNQRLLPTGQKLTLTPAIIPLSARATDLYTDGNFAFVKTSGSVQKVNLLSGKSEAETSIAGGASLCGIDRNDKVLVVTNAQKQLLVLDPNSLAIQKTIDLGNAPAGGPAYPCGVKLSPDGSTAWVALNRANQLVRVNLSSGKIEEKINVGVAPYGVQIDGERILVTCWGRPVRANKPKAASSGTEVETDERGASPGGELIEVNGGKVTHRWPVAGEPTETLIDKDQIFVTCANGNAIQRIDRRTNQIQETRLVGPTGGAPSSLTLHQGQLWVALSGENRLASLDLKTGKLKSSLPTGWYPVAVRSTAAGLVVADAKGDGRPTQSVSGIIGSLRILDPTRAKPVPAEQAPRSALKLPIKHIVYVVKENRTYDQLLGDLDRGRRDKSLVMFGRDITPNHHAIAEQFVLLDNFACNGSISTDGHAWAIEGQSTAFYERSFGGWTRAYPWGDEPLAISEGGSLWDAAIEAGKSFRNFGEYVYAKPKLGFEANYQAWKTGKEIAWTSAIGVERLKKFTAMDFPGWSMAIPDGYRMDRFIKEFRQMESANKMPDLTLLYLPQDHTSGNAAGMPTPRAHVADNDLAVGRLVEAISKSKFWKETAIFVVEDDPQDGLDSVDGHRSVCLVASPYTKRGATVSDFYNQTSILKTICHFLGIKPYTQFIAQSSAMDACFMSKPDLTPYQARIPKVALNELNPPNRSAVKLDFSQPDATDEEVMDRVLWQMAFGNRPYPNER